MMRVAGLVGVVIFMSGCGASPPYQVSGAVTFEGKPVPVGEIVFTPDSSKGNSGPAFLADIIDGKYQSPAGRGHVGGAYTVRLIGFDGKPAQAKGLVDQRGTPLFVEYTEAFDLPAAPSVQNFQVPSKR